MAEKRVVMSNETESSSVLQNPGQELDLNLRRYAAALGYLQYENTTYWTRSQHFLVAHTFLLGFVVTKLPVTSKELTWARIVCLGIASLGGLVLAKLWFDGLKAGEYWITHVTEVVRLFEGKSFPVDTRLIQKFDPKPGYVSAKLVAHRLATLFSVLWFASFVYLALCAALMAVGYTLA
jgi:hypothetical protein